MLFYTGIARTASDIAKSYVGNIKDKEKQLDYMQELVTKAFELINSRQDIQKLGKLLNDFWQIKRSLSTSVSNPKIDKLYQRALSCGALGGKLLGAGGGGFILLFVPQSHQAKVKKEFSKLIHVPFKFEHEGSQIIFYDQQENYSFTK